MAWIETTPENETVGEMLAAVTPKGAEPDAILAIHGPKAEGLQAHLALYQSAMRATPELSGMDRELIAVVVSQLNGCHY